VRFIVGLFIFVTAASAQTLTIRPVQTSPGSEFQVEISIASPAARAPAILKWDTVFPAQLLDVVGTGPETGKDSGKSIACAMQKPYSYTCVLFGGMKPIADGVIATIRFKVHADAPPGKTAIRVQKIDAATVDAKSFTMPDAEAPLEIR
jgi:Cohesin domain